jgi:F-box interacting protein
MHRLLENTSLTIANDPYFDSLGYICPVGSCNGLLLLTYNSSDSESWLLYLWNPATRSLSDKIGFNHCGSQVYSQYKVYSHCWNCGFGYDNSTGTYKIVAFCRSHKEVKVLSIGDNVWRNIQSFPDVYLIISHSGVYANGSLNWLTIRNQSHNENWKNVPINQYFVIISLDLSTETYRPLLLPPLGGDKARLIRPKLVVLMDFLCFSYDFNKTDLIIWQMKEFGVQESWIQLLKVSYQSLPIVYNVSCSRSVLFPLCFYENSDTLVLAWDRGKQAILYNLRDNTAEKTGYTNYFRWFGSKEYVESLVSTC